MKNNLAINPTPAMRTLPALLLVCAFAVCAATAVHAQSTTDDPTPTEPATDDRSVPVDQTPADSRSASGDSSLSDVDLIAATIAPLPPEHRDGAEVRSWTDEGELIVVREGTSAMVCLADQPGDDRFHAACYHRALEPFMARGRELKADGLSRDAVQSTREEEIEAGTLRMPDHPAALYSLTGPADSYDPETREVVGASPLYVIYMPYATAATTGLPESAPRGQPWLMNAGKPWAHVMLIPAEE